MKKALLILLLSHASANASLDLWLQTNRVAHPGAPDLLVVGDSISEGYTNWLTTLDGGPSGNPLGDVAQRMYFMSGNKIIGTNLSKSGAGQAYVQLAVDQYTALHPKFVFIHVGINGITSGWTNIYFDHMLNTCRTNGSIMILDQVWPWTSLRHTDITNFNAQTANWAATNTVYTNGLYLLQSHDFMANPTTNYLIWPPYTWDSQHPTIAGTDELASLLMQKIYSICGNYVEAADTSQAAVSNAVAAAVSGDIVQIPAGSNVWVTTVAVPSTKNIHIRGMSTNDTILIDEIATSNSSINLYPGCFFYFDGTAKNQLSNLQMARGVTNTAVGLPGNVVFDFNATDSRVWHCYFNDLRSANLRTYAFRALADWNYHRFFLSRQNPYSPFMTGGIWGLFGDNSWASPSYLGTVNALYIENNFIDCQTNTFLGATDGYGGSHFVVRSNLFVNARLDMHGTQSTGRNRGTRAWEFYNNVFSNLVGAASQVIDLRSGTGVIYSNHISGAYTSLATASDYRQAQTEPYEGLHPELGGWGGADGTNQWDTIVGGVFETVTHTGSNGATTLTDTNKAWTVNQWVGYTLINLNQNSIEQTNEHRFAVITSNGTNTLDYATSNRENPIKMTWTNGWTGQIRKVSFTLDHIGAGRSDLLTGTYPIPQDLHQELEPVYSWNNERGGDTNTLKIVTNYPASEVEGQDYYNNTIMPGYTALVYPFPIDTPAVVVTPTSATLAYGAQQDFNASGGSGSGYTWEITVNNTGASIDNTGLYTAGPMIGTNLVRGFDGYGYFADAAVTDTGGAAPNANNVRNGSMWRRKR